MESRKRKIFGATSWKNLGTTNQVESLSGRMMQLFMSDKCSDVVLIVKEERIPAHRYILAAGNKYFQDLFSDSTQKEIHLEVPLEAFKAVLRYIYSGQICLLDLDDQTVVDILALSHMYDFAELVQAITEYLKKIVTMNNVLVIFKMAVRLKLEGLKSFCHAFMDENASRLLVHESLKTFPKELLQQVLARDTFLVPEIRIFNAVREWSNANSDADIAPLLSCVRLPLLSDIELSEVRKSGFLEFEAGMNAIRERDASEKLTYRVSPGKNMVSPKYGSIIIQGLWVRGPPPVNSIFPNDLKDTTASTSPAVKNDKDKGIVVQLGMISFINNIEMRLSGADVFSYFVEISTNQSQWERVVEYTNCHCQNLQSLQFPPKPVKYIKVVGTRDNGLQMAAFKATYKEIMWKQVNGFLAASIEICGAGVEKKPILLSRLYKSYYEIQLDQPYFVGLVRIFVSSLQSYNLEVKISTDSSNWRCIANKEDQFEHWQNISFDPCPVVFIRINSNRCFENTTEHFITFEE